MRWCGGGQIRFGCAALRAARAAAMAARRSEVRSCYSWSFLRVGFQKMKVAIGASATAHPAIMSKASTARLARVAVKVRIPQAWRV